MGPIIIIDKSVLQSLGLKTVPALYKHYFVVHTDILLNEILADLTKEEIDDLVNKFYRKLSSLDGVFSLDYRTIILKNLLGEKIPMDGRPMVWSEKVGSDGAIVDQYKENSLLMKWRSGKFDVTDFEFAKKWRESIAAFDVEDFRKTILHSNTYQKPKTKEELVKWTKALTSSKNKEHVLSVIQGLLRNFKLEEFLNPIFKRWHDSGLPDLNGFSPYVFYYCWVLQTYSYGTVFNLFTPKRTNLLDIQYVFYLPFCYAFVTNDDFQSEFAGLFATSQTIVKGTDFKADLENITNVYEKMTPEEREEREFQYGSYPPENEDSVTWQLWKKYMRPWKQGMGNKAVKYSKEEGAKIASEIMKKIRGQ